MNERPLSVIEVIRMVNHDFLNELQLLSMHLQLGNVDAVYARIEEFQQQSQQTSKLSKLQLPKTVEWLLTAHWRFPALQLNIVNECSNEVDVSVDETLAAYLEHTVIHVYKKLDPFTDQACTITLTNDPTLQLVCHLQGKWESTESLQYANNKSISINIVEHSETVITVSFKKE